MIGDVRTILLDLPCRVKGFTFKDRDETHVIVLNSRLSYEQNRATYEHELLHVNNGDLYRDCDVCEVETEYHA